MSDRRPPAAPATDDLPEHVRKLVHEIESEIGEDGEEPWDTLQAPPPMATDGRVEQAVRDILVEIGEDPEREGLLRTPERVHRMYHELTAGYHVDPDRLINDAIFEVDYSRDGGRQGHPVLQPVRAPSAAVLRLGARRVHPKGRVIGLSKIPRVVEMYARRLQVQERLTQQVADFLMQHLEPEGVGVVVEATHLCAAMRGVRKPGTVMTTSAVLGLFRRNDKTRAEFFAHLERPAPRA